MNCFTKIAYWLGIVVLLSVGIEGIFGINLIDRALVNFHVIHYLFQISCLFAGALMMLHHPIR